MNPSPVDLLRREWYLLRLGWAMQDFPQRAYRRIRSELRAGVTAAAQDVGMAAALADLGHPRALAEGYVASLGRRLPRWTSGTVAAAVAVGFVLYLAGAYGVGVLDVLDAQGGGSYATEVLGATTTFTASDDALTVVTEGSWAALGALALLAAVVFVLTARVWRALPRSVRP